MTNVTTIKISDQAMPVTGLTSARAALAGRWKALQVEQPKLRIRDAAAALQVSECELLQTNIGDITSFPAGTGDAHKFVNHAGEDCVLLVVGDRSAGDAASYPEDDIVAVARPGGGWRFSHKDGTPY